MGDMTITVRRTRGIWHFAVVSAGQCRLHTSQSLSSGMDWLAALRGAPCG